MHQAKRATAATATVDAEAVRLEYGWNSNDPHVKRLLTWLKKRYDAKEEVRTEELVEWDRTHGKHVFPWDDEEVARAHRLHLARKFMERFAFRLNGFRVSGWYSVKRDTEEGTDEEPSAGRAYYPLPAVADDDSLRVKVIADVSKRLESHAATLRFLKLSTGERSDVLKRVDRAMSAE